MKTLLALILFGCALSAQARLLETRDQCIKRYGATYRAYEKTFIEWKKNGITITAIFEGDACVRITYLRDSNIAFSSAEFAKLLAANSNGKIWSPYSEPASGKKGEIYLTQDEQLLAEKSFPYELVFKNLAHHPKDLKAIQDAHDIVSGKMVEGF